MQTEKLKEESLGYKQIETELKFINQNEEYKNQDMVKQYKEWLLDNTEYFAEINVEQSIKVSKNIDAQIKQCYYNCLKATFGRRFKYYEGYVWSNRIQIPLEHSWLVKDGQVIDPTLIIKTQMLGDRMGDEYLGIELPLKFILKQALKTKRSGPFIFDYFLGEVLKK